ncbi:MAG: bacillithiol biosynthesis deacetylase BshB1 [Planctomycetes bacterium]|nr:bacillithiol biosynthesis deacetylase BshB1 [Planctomycetota bacterium]
MKLDFLVVAAHPDDAEISVGGTILRLIDAGARVGIVDCTRGEMGTRGTQADRDNETAAADRLMRIHARFNLNLPDARVEVNVENREKLAALIRRTKPSAILAHHPEDLHPDHMAAGELARKAWYLSGLKRLAQLSGDEEAHRPAHIFHFLSHIPQDPTLVVDITSVWKRKLELVHCYGSQLTAQAPDDKGEHFLFGSNIEERIHTKARFFGEKIGVLVGEPLVHMGPLPENDPLRQWLNAS